MFFCIKSVYVNIKFCIISTKTERELQILKAMMSGDSNAQIAER
ncbi:MAG: LuxR C-terminal-related transcriptional regulator [Bacilli bacterium]